jgi:hypothetical protein
MTEDGKWLVTQVRAEIRKTFETVAKLALQGAAEADDDSLNVIEKARKAHSRVTLIIDDAMRGLAEVNECMFVGGIMVASAVDLDAEEPPSPRGEPLS